MKRDAELVRQILQEFEQKDPQTAGDFPTPYAKSEAPDFSAGKKESF